MEESCKLPHSEFGAKMLSKCKKIVYSLTLFGVRYKGIVKTNRNFVVSLKAKILTEGKF